MTKATIIRVLVDLSYICTSKCDMTLGVRVAPKRFYSDSVRLSATPARGCHVAPFLGSKRGVPVEVRVTDGGICTALGGVWP